MPPTAYCAIRTNWASCIPFSQHMERKRARLGTDNTLQSDVCHAKIKPLTAPRGWRCVPKLIDAMKRWYKHLYEKMDTGERQDHAPPGTMSFCEVQPHPLRATTEFVCLGFVCLCVTHHDGCALNAMFENSSRMKHTINTHE